MKRVRDESVTAVRYRLDISGVVQGVGFRPAVVRVASAHELTGLVYNDSGCVHCELEGTPRTSRRRSPRFATSRRRWRASTPSG